MSCHYLVYTSANKKCRGLLVKSRTNHCLCRITGNTVVARRVLRHFRTKTDIALEASLSEQETEVLTLNANGMNRTDIARLLGISANTAAGYILRPSTRS